MLIVFTYLYCLSFCLNKQFAVKAKLMHFPKVWMDKGPTAATKTNFGSCPMGNCHLGSYRLGNFFSENIYCSVRLTCAQIGISIVLLCLPVHRQEYLVFRQVNLCPDRDTYCSVMFTCAQIGISIVLLCLPVPRQEYLLFYQVQMCTDRNIYCSVRFTCAQIEISIVP